jgi:hypothetical protein
MKQLTLLVFLFLISFLCKSQDISFKKLRPCTFGIEIPVNMQIKKMYEDSSPEYCDYEVVLKDGYTIMELHSLINTRFEFGTIKELYNEAVKTSNLNITYKMSASNYFVISGVNNENGNIVYWKRVLGQQFVSDLRIEYNQSKKSAIEKYIGRISKSFISD